MKRIYSITIAFIIAVIMALPLMGCKREILPFEGAAIPYVHQYDAQESSFKLSRDARILDASMQTDWTETLKLIAEELSQEGLTESSIEVVSSSSEDARNGDIVVKYDSSLDPQAYRIEVTDTVLRVSATDDDGVFYGLRTVIKFLRSTDNSITCGTINDAPDMQIRALHLAMANRLYDKAWVIKTIKLMSWNNLNQLQLHFGEIYGLRFKLDDMNVDYVDSDGNQRSVDCSIALTEPYFTEADMDEIIETARLYHIDVIGALDTPGHMQQMLKPVMDAGLIPESYGVTVEYNMIMGADGLPLNYLGANLNDRGAINYTLAFLEKYITCFADNGCTDFCVGGDEYIDFIKDGSISKDTFNAYINEACALVSSYNITPRVWNDGAAAGITDKNAVIENWSGAYADFADYRQINLNYYRLYFTIEDTEEWRKKADPQSLYESWEPLVFAKDRANTNTDVFGVMYGIWGGSEDQDYVWEHVVDKLCAMFTKSWNCLSTTKNADRAIVYTYDEYLAHREPIN